MLRETQKIFSLHRIQAEVLKGITPSVDLLGQLGFHNEGLLKQYEK